MLNIVYAKLPDDKPNNTKIEQTEPFNYGNSVFYGWKMTYLKYVNNPNSTSEKDKVIQVVDESKPVEYDNITQQIIDTQNNSKLSSQSMLNNMNQQRFNSQIMLDNMNLQKMASQLMLEVNQLKTGGNK